MNSVKKNERKDKLKEQKLTERTAAKLANEKQVIAEQKAEKKAEQ